MALPPEVMKELIASFRIDVDDQLQAVTDSMLALEKETDKAARRELLHAAMRAAHNIKGAARGIGVGEVGAVSHSFESLLTRLMNEDTEFTPGIGDLCFETVDAIKAAMQAFIDETKLSFDKDDLIARLDGNKPGVKPPVVKSTPEPKPEPKHEPKPEPKPDSVKTGQPAKGGEMLRVSVDKLDRLESLIEGIYASKIDMDDFIAELSTLQATIQSLSANDAGQCDEVAANLDRIHKFMRSRGRSMGLALSSIRQDMRTLRLVPATGLTRPLARSVRDISRQLEKQISFKSIGDETEMDRAVMELLTDPLVHLLRNAIDHGIETPAERKAAGKPEEGSIEVSFRLEGGMVRIALVDDGRGIDTNKVRQAAIAKKVIGADEARDMSHDKILDLLFHPGFSTKQIITDVSGRGVGLDIVRSNIQALRGDINVETREGEGSTFTLSVPLTMVTERGLLVSAANQVFAIPVSNVERVIDAHVDDLTDLEGGKVLMVAGQPVALRMLSKVLDLNAYDDSWSDRFTVVIVVVGMRRVALIVDDILGQREMVVRPLSVPLVNVRGIAGGTLVGGHVRMVLDPAGLINKALRSASVDGLDKSDAAAQTKSILAVDDSLTTRTLVKNVLESAGYDVTSAVNGEEAWKILGDTTFDLVVTDVEMPKMNGFELTRNIKQSDSHADLPVIIVTSLASDEDKQMGIDVGADAYIMKGDFETRVLLDVVEQLI